ncbi:hypothetical protein NZK32_16980 [Cyanobium sp. FGCU-52]|nr:hypothetical protein [Cyanobium sp. FGCU52]
MPFALRRSHPLVRLGMAAVLACGIGSGAVAPSAAQSTGLGQIVRAMCLSAFENEVAQSGKRAPAGMADYACGCVADRIQDGSSVDAARNSCREATARRYPI